MKRRGQMTIQVLIFATIGVLLISGFALWADVNLRATYRSLNKGVAFEAAQAGVEYYRWHLSHAVTDYYDGNPSSTSPGPYVHPYYDKEGRRLGQFSLLITPPPGGVNGVATVESTGVPDADPSIQKVIRVRLGIQSLVKYAIVGNDGFTFATGTVVYGSIHSNNGIHFDGVAHNLVTSAVYSYDDPDHGGGLEYGVHTHLGTIDPLPPTPLPARPDVFLGGRKFPVPVVDFNGITAQLATMKSDAQAIGTYFPPSGRNGYHMVLRDNGQFDVYKVTELQPKLPSCNNVNNEDGWGTWSIKTEAYLGTYAIPQRGVVFFEDDAWVSGQIKNSRLSVAVARFPQMPSTGASITINDNVVYTYYDGRDALGLVAQKNINFGLIAADNLRVDAAMVAQTGRIGRYYYRPPSSQGQGSDNCQQWNVRNSITSYGMLASYKPYLFSQLDGTGFLNKYLNYDANMLYDPPPEFPFISTQRSIISWEELK